MGNVLWVNMGFVYHSPKYSHIYIYTHTEAHTLYIYIYTCTYIHIHTLYISVFQSFSFQLSMQITFSLQVTLKHLVLVAYVKQICVAACLC